MEKIIEKRTREIPEKELYANNVKANQTKRKL